jgi:hypothetical protein
MFVDDKEKMVAKDFAITTKHTKDWNRISINLML